MRHAVFLFASLWLGSCELLRGQGVSIDYHSHVCPSYGRPANGAETDRHCYLFEAVAGEKVEAICLGTDRRNPLTNPGCAVFIGSIDGDSFAVSAESDHDEATADYTIPETGNYIVEAWYQRQGFFFAETFSLTQLSLPTCISDANSLCLGGWRFRVTADWQSPDGTSGHGNAFGLTDESGYFSFFDAANVEVVVKVHGACGFNQRWWVFAGGLTNVQVLIKVTDTVTGESKEYPNSQGVAFSPVQDTAAFPCP